MFTATGQLLASTMLYIRLVGNFKGTIYQTSYLVSKVLYIRSVTNFKSTKTIPVTIWALYPLVQNFYAIITWATANIWMVSPPSFTTQGQKTASRRACRASPSPSKHPATLGVNLLSRHTITSLSPTDNPCGATMVAVVFCTRDAAFLTSCLRSGIRGRKLSCWNNGHGFSTFVIQCKD